MVGGLETLEIGVRTGEEDTLSFCPSLFVFLVLPRARVHVSVSLSGTAYLRALLLPPPPPPPSSQLVEDADSDCDSLELEATEQGHQHEASAAAELPPSALCSSSSSQDGVSQSVSQRLCAALAQKGQAIDCVICHERLAPPYRPTLVQHATKQFSD